MKRNIALALGVLIVTLTIAMLHWRDEDAADAAVSKQANVGRSHDTTMAAYPPALPDTPLSVPPPAVAPLGKNATELCGYGNVDPEQIPTVFEGVADAAILAVLDGFEQARDPRKRALGLAT